MKETKRNQQDPIPSLKLILHKIYVEGKGHHCVPPWGNERMNARSSVRHRDKVSGNKNERREKTKHHCYTQSE
jgi:hypothetical protein